MIYYIDNMLEDIPVNFAGELVMTASAHIFDTNEETDKLDLEKAAELHHLIANNIFLCKMAHTDILLVTGFISTRVNPPGIDDWKNFSNNLQYLWATKNLQLMLEAYDIHVVK